MIQIHIVLRTKFKRIEKTNKIKKDIEDKIQMNLKRTNEIHQTKLKTTLKTKFK
jgi:hypothetical protein